MRGEVTSNINYQAQPKPQLQLGLSLLYIDIQSLALILLNDKNLVLLKRKSNLLGAID